MSTIHEEYPYTITCHTDDLAVVHCLRSLAQWAQQSGQKFRSWGGTKKKDWERSGHCITLHFSSPEFRYVFRQKANELLGGKWSEISTSDNDPAIPVRRRA